MLRKNKKPNVSVKAVTNAADANAESTFAYFSPRGIIIPITAPLKNYKSSL
ncbi:MAG: hypothetical protein ACW99A_15605 [Candidatus Kariarchaeaceae archaeon]|jgi:hypothetical protein